MTTTYDCIATTTLSSATLEINFNSIASTWTDLVLIVVPKTTIGTAQMLFQLNGDTASNYSIVRMGGNGSVTGSDAPAPTAFGQLSWWGYMGSTDGQIIQADFMNYKNTNTHKTVISRNSNAAYGVGINVSTWRNTSAITSIKIYSDASNLAIGTTASLYGIKAE